MSKLLDYNELKAINLPLVAKVQVHNLANGYKFESSARWCLGVYSQNWGTEHNIRFTVED